MKLIDIMSPTLVFPALSAGGKTEALRQMVHGIAEEFPKIQEEPLFGAVLDRERISSTGIGSGIAIPHAKLPDLHQHIAAFGRSRKGIDFDAIDGKPVHLVFLIVGPVGANEAHLKVLARISKFLHDGMFRDRLITAENAMLIYDAIAEKDAEY